jgi:hypothetical protein
MFASIDYVTGLSEADQPILEEIKRVLISRKANTRFGVCLLHGHPRVGEDDEHILVETSDLSTGTLVTRPVERSKVSSDAVVETVWKFDDLGNRIPMAGCQKKLDGTHA